MLTIRDTRDDFRGKPCTTAVLPIGAVEQHGKHLPVGTDLLLAEAVARRLAEKLDAFLLPAIAISASIEHRKAKGTVYLRAETLAQIVRDVALSLRDSGFTRLIVASFHGGNWILKPAVRELNRDFAPFRAVLLTPDLPADDLRAIFEHPVGDVHGGEYETSLMLHLHPEVVRQPLPSGGNREYPPQPLLDYFDSTELAPEGFWGWPEAATAEKGARAFEALIAAHLHFLQQIETMEQKLSSAARGEVSLRPMRPGDISFAHQLRDLAGWNQTERDWRGYLEFEPNGCFVAELGGQPAGTATTIRYGERFGWIGMVLVHPDHRRHGIGSLLLRKAIDYLRENGVRCIKLDATPMGKRVYVPLGFVDEYELSRYERVAPAVAFPDARDLGPYANSDVAEVGRLDSQAFGADRGHVLASMSARDPRLCFVSRDEGGLHGYLIARHGARAVQVGPWVARDVETADHLLQALLSRVEGKTVFIDVPAPNVPGVALLEKYGFRVQRTLTRMFLGENTSPGDPRLIYSISSPEKG